MKLRQHSIHARAGVASTLVLLALVATSIISFLPHERSVQRKAAHLFDKPDEAMRYYVKRHTGRSGASMPTEYILHELEKAGIIGPASLRKTDVITWSEIGPDNIGGRTRELIIDPSSSSTIYVASVGGGVWKSANSGGTWSSTTDGLGNIAFTCLAMAPGGSTSMRTMYGGTGEGFGNIDAIGGAGLYMTTNSGTAWTQIHSTSTFGTRYINKVAVDPTNANYVYVASNNGLWRSTNAGTSFSSIGFSGSRVQDVHLHPTLTDTMWVAVYGSGVYKAPDVKATTPTFTNIRSYAGQKRIELCGAPSKPSVIYVMFTDASSEPWHFDYTGDGGVTWFSGSIPTNDDSFLTSYMNGQGWYDNTVGVDPSNELHVFVGGVDSYHSTDGGATWSKMTSWRSHNAPYAHADIHQLTFQSSTVFYMVSDGGVYKTADGGVTWSSSNTSYSVTQFYYGAFSNTGSVYIGGTQDNGTLRRGGGNSWTEIYGGDGGASIISHANDANMFSAYVFGELHYSTNSGSSWIDVSPPGAGGSNYLFIAPAEQSPSNASTIYTGGTNFYRSTSNGTSWTNLDATPSTSIISALAVSISGDTMVYGTDQGHVRRTTNGGSSWSTVGPSGPTYITDVDLCLSNANVCYITASGYVSNKHIYKCTNLGSASPTWTDVSTSLPALPAMSVAIERLNANHVLVGYEAGIYETTNAGSSWTAANSGMVGAASVEDIDTRYNGDAVAFTHGRGAFTSSAPLPVELSVFTAVRTRDGAKLFWTTATEVNNHGFNVQRRDDGSWRTIAFIKGNGTSATQNAYSYLDRTIGRSSVVYRLQQVDRDGTASFSPERVVDGSRIDRSHQILSISPQPASSGDRVRIQFTTTEPIDCDIQLVDAQGRIVLASRKQLYAPGVHLTDIPLIGLPNSFYVARIVSAVGATSRMILVTK